MGESTTLDRFCDDPSLKRCKLVTGNCNVCDIIWIEMGEELSC